MVNFRRNPLLPALVLATLSSPVPGQIPERQPISLDADASAFDRKLNMLTFEGLRITQGGLGIEADAARATGLDFEQSRWHFEGDVRITLDTVLIEAAEADFRFANHELVSGELRGDPVVFEDSSETRAQPIRGGADHVRYSNADGGSLRFTANAWLTEGPNEITGCDLVYDLLGQRVTSGSSDCGEPIRITIIPPEEGAETDSAISP